MIHSDIYWQTTSFGMIHILLSSLSYSMNKPDYDKHLQTKMKLHQLNITQNNIEIFQQAWAELNLLNSHVFPVTMVSGPILYIHPKLVLPIQFSFR